MKIAISKKKSYDIIYMNLANRVEKDNRIRYFYIKKTD
jgi:hypothetical protein